MFFKTKNVDSVSITLDSNSPDTVTFPSQTTDDSEDTHSILIDGYQNYLHTLVSVGTAQSIMFAFTGTSVQVHQIMCLSEELKLDPEDNTHRIRFNQIDYDLQLSGEVRESARRQKRYVAGLGNARDKWRVNYTIEFLRRANKLQGYCRGRTDKVYP